MENKDHNPKDSKVGLWLDESTHWPRRADLGEEGIPLTEAGNNTVASLDHDPREGTDGGYRLVVWMAEIFARDSVEP